MLYLRRRINQQLMVDPFVKSSLVVHFEASVLTVVDVVGLKLVIGKQHESISGCKRHAFHSGS
jgi:hypothetical protein